MNAVTGMWKHWQLLLIFILRPTLCASEPPTARLWLEDGVGTPGSTVSLCLMASFPSELKALTASITFDPKIMIDAADLTTSGSTQPIACLNPVVPDFFHAEQGISCVSLGIVLGINSAVAACPASDSIRIASIDAQVLPTAVPGDVLPVSLAGTCGLFEKASCLALSDGSGGSVKVCPPDLALGDAAIQVAPEECHAPDQLAFLREAQTVILSWRNPSLYREVQVVRNGIILSTLPPDGTTYSDPNACASHAYQIRGILDCSRSCRSQQLQVPACFRRGEVNQDGLIDIGDAVGTLFFLFAGKGITCQLSADSNSDDRVDLSDVTYTLGYLFLGGPAPKQPFPACGSATASAVLNCESFRACE